MPLNFVNSILDFELNLDINREDALKAIFKHFETSFNAFLRKHKAALPTIYLIAFADGKQLTKHYDGTDFYFPSSPLLFFGRGSKKEEKQKIATIRAFTYITGLQNISVTSTLNEWVKLNNNDKFIKGIGLVHVSGEKVNFKKDKKLTRSISVRNKKVLPEFEKLVHSVLDRDLEDLLNGSVEINFDLEQTKKVISAIGIEVKDQETSFKFLAPLLSAYAAVSGFNHIYYLPSVKLIENAQLESLGFIIVSSNTQLNFDETNLLKVAGGVLLGNIGLIESNFQTKRAIHKPHIKEIDYNPEYLYLIASKIANHELDKDVIIRYFEKDVIRAISRLKRSNLRTKNEIKAAKLVELEKHFSVLNAKVEAEFLLNSNLKDELIQFNKLLDSKPKQNDSCPLRHPIQFITVDSDWSYYQQLNLSNDVHIRNLDDRFFDRVFKPIVSAINTKDKSKLGFAISAFQNATSNQLINGIDSFSSFCDDDKPIVLFTKDDWEIINKIIKENYCLRANGLEQNYNSIIKIECDKKQIEFKLQSDKPLNEESRNGLLTSLNRGFREFKLSHLKHLVCGKYNSALIFLNVSEKREIISLDSDLTEKAKWIDTEEYSDYSKGFYYILKF